MARMRVTNTREKTARRRRSEHPSHCGTGATVGRRPLASTPEEYSGGGVHNSPTMVVVLRHASWKTVAQARNHR
jgi:hypothetical protein